MTHGFAIWLIHLWRDHFICDMPHQADVAGGSYLRVRVCVCVNVHVRVCEHARVRACVPARARPCVGARARVLCASLCAITKKKKRSWVIYYFDVSWNTWMGHVACRWVMSQMNGSRHKWVSHVGYEWVMSRMNGWCLIYDMTLDSLILNESCSIWMSHVTYE